MKSLLASWWIPQPLWLMALSRVKLADKALQNYREANAQRRLDAIKSQPRGVNAEGGILRWSSDAYTTFSVAQGEEYGLYLVCHC